MDPRYDWLNIQVDRLQAGETLRRDISRVAYEPRDVDATLLEMAAKLNGLRPGASCPDRAFVVDLRNRVKAACLRPQD